MLPGRGQGHGGDPARAVGLDPLDGERGRPLRALRPEARQGVSLGEGLLEVGGLDAVPAREVGDVCAQAASALAAAGVLEGGRRPRVVARARPLAEVGLLEVEQELLRLGGPEQLADLAGIEPLVADLSHDAPEGGGADGHEAAAVAQEAADRPQRAVGDGACVGEDEQVEVLAADHKAVREGAGADEGDSRRAVLRLADGLGQLARELGTGADALIGHDGHVALRRPLVLELAEDGGRRGTVGLLHPQGLLGVDRDGGGELNGGEGLPPVVAQPQRDDGMSRAAACGGGQAEAVGAFALDLGDLGLDDLVAVGLELAVELDLARRRRQRVGRLDLERRALV